jgi:hypothetical protein
MFEGLKLRTWYALRRFSLGVLVPVFRPLVHQILFHDLMKNPLQLDYIRTRIDLLDKYDELFPGARECGTKFEVHDLAIQAVEPSEDRTLWLEFGVWTGETINYIARRTPATVYGFDSFEGLPVDWKEGTTSRSYVKKDHFKMHALPRVRKNVQLIKGWFDQSLPGFLGGHPGNAAYLHIDSDVYESARVVFDLVAPRIVPGTVIVFDEYFNYPTWKDHEYKAFQEFLQARQLGTEALAFNSAGEQAAFRIRGNHG